MIDGFVDDYAKSISYYLKAIPKKSFKDALDLLKYHRPKHRVFVGGNGGSAAISNHLTCDFSKGCALLETAPLVTHSLSTNIELITAIANDISYEEIFSKQLEFMGLKEKDIVILISSSGNSPNIVDAADYSRKIGSTVIGLTGFDGGKLKEMCDISFHIPVNNYGIVEDCHQAVMHMLAQMHVRQVKEWF